MYKAFVLAVGCVLTSLAAAEESYGEIQYWASIASFPDQQQADDFQARAAAAMGNDLTVIGWDTPQGYFYRVVAGPYLSQTLAQDRVDSARNVGFGDAWVWVDRVVSRYDTGIETRPESAPSLPKTSDPLPKLVEKAPPGYQLNRLRREPDGS